MSFYSLDFTVPKNTLETAPYEQKLPIRPGILHQVRVQIPPGHAGLTGCAIDHGLHQLAPTSQNSWFRGDDSVFEYPEWVEIRQGMGEIGLRGYNLDDTFDHTFMISVGVLPEWAINSAIRVSEQLEPIGENILSLAKFFKPLVV